MATIKFGPSGLGPVKEAIANLEEYHRLGLNACEVAFTYGAYIKKDDAIKIGKVAKRLGIILSVHASYYVNLNSKEEEKVEASKKRILKCCEIGYYLGAKRVIFHSGFYSGMESDEAFGNIKNGILEMMVKVSEEEWGIELCPEVMGKKNVFGSIDEISRLVEETGCGFCIDFAHVLARYGRYEFDDVIAAFPQKKWHCHFSGIDYGEKGEKNHKRTLPEYWEKVLKFMAELNKEIVIICESPSPVEDSLLGKQIFGRL
jgi:deoxyribonuclease IV